MGKEQYNGGEMVPEAVCSVPTDWNFVRFAVGVEVYRGDDGEKHIYPKERVDDTTDLFVIDAETVDQVIADDVQLYTVPHEMLR